MLVLQGALALGRQRCSRFLRAVEPRSLPAASSPPDPAPLPARILPPLGSPPAGACSPLGAPRGPTCLRSPLQRAGLGRAPGEVQKGTPEGDSPDPQPPRPLRPPMSTLCWRWQQEDGGGTRCEERWPRGWPGRAGAWLAASQFLLRMLFSFAGCESSYTAQEQSVTQCIFLSLPL